MSNQPAFVAPRRRRPGAPGPGARHLQRPASPTCTDAPHRLRRPAGTSSLRCLLPFVRVHTDTVARRAQEAAQLELWLVAGPGRYETTPTRPDCWRLLPGAKFELLLRNHHGSLEVGTSTHPIPCIFVCRARPHRRQHDAAAPPADARRVRPADLAAMDDGIANGTWQPRPATPGAAGAVHRAARGLFAAPPAPLHRHAPEHFQNFVLFTNYQFYIDEFVRLGHERWQTRQRDYIAFVEPGNVVTRRTRSLPRNRATNWAPAAAPAANARLPPGAATTAGITMVNIGVGPANAKTITDHIAVLRAARLDDAGPLRRPAQHQAARRLRAGPRLRARRPRARRGTAAVGADSRAGRNAAGAGAGGGRRHPAARATS